MSRKVTFQAFEQLVDRWQQRLWRHAWRLTGEGSRAAWDALQEAWIGISRGLHRLAEPAAFSAWAYQIVGHEVAATGCDLTGGSGNSMSCGASEVHESYGPEREPEQYADLREALARLPGPDRAIMAPALRRRIRHDRDRHDTLRAGGHGEVASLHAENAFASIWRRPMLNAEINWHRAPPKTDRSVARKPRSGRPTQYPASTGD